MHLHTSERKRDEERESKFSKISIHHSHDYEMSLTSFCAGSLEDHKNVSSSVKVLWALNQSSVRSFILPAVSFSIFFFFFLFVKCVFKTFFFFFCLRNWSQLKSSH